MNAKLIFGLLIAASRLLFAADSKPVATECGAILGKKYVSVVTEQMLSKQPKWDPLATQIPLAADAACRKALVFANEKWNFHNVTDQLGQWDVRTISLGRLEKSDWVYVIEIVQRGPIQGVQNTMKLLVLLDETVVQPMEAGRAID